MILLYFAWVREQIGTDSETVTPPAKIATVAALLDWLATRSPAHAGALADRSRIRVALDDEFASPDSPVSGVQEVAIFPPVTGG